MTIKRILKILELVFITSIILIVSIVTFYIIRSNSYEKRFEKLKTGKDMEAVTEEWGEPDYSFIHQDTFIVISYNDGIMTDYVFKFDKYSKTLIEKWSGD